MKAPEDQSQLKLSDIIAVLQGLHNRFGDQCVPCFKTPDDQHFAIDCIAVDDAGANVLIVMSQSEASA